MNNPTLLKNLRNIPYTRSSVQRRNDPLQKREVHEDYAKRIV